MRRLVAVCTLAAGLYGCPADKTAPPPAEAPSSAPASAPAAQAETSDKGTTPETRDQTDADGVVRRGVAVAHDEAMTLAALFEEAKSLDGKTVTVTGEVTEVCTKKGCWMALRSEDGGPSVRVTAQDYAYFVPDASKGKQATVKGKVSVKVLDKATADHYAAESEKPDEAPAAGSVEIALASVGLEIR